MISSFATFKLEIIEPDDPDDPAGESLLEELKSAISGFDEASIDLWRGTGWSLDLSSTDACFQIYISLTEDNHWYLGISPTGLPSFFQRLFGSKTPNYLPELEQLSLTVFDHLNQSGAIGQQWSINADPTESEVSSPNELSWSSFDVSNN